MGLLRVSVPAGGCRPLAQLVACCDRGHTQDPLSTRHKARSARRCWRWTGGKVALSPGPVLRGVHGRAVRVRREAAGRPPLPSQPRRGGTARADSR